MSDRDVHVLPINDLREHVEDRACWCAPRLEFDPAYGAAAVVVHHAADLRETIEEHGPH